MKHWYSYKFTKQISYQFSHPLSPRPSQIFVKFEELNSNKQKSRTSKLELIFPPYFFLFLHGSQTSASSEVQVAAAVGPNSA